jgi:2-polyprenyl-3-methyl-5-hydroxy-6-metoxy-1,4-benzoquinol methylase
MHRVSDALTARPAPGVEIVDNPKAANVQVLHVVGDGQHAMEVAGHPKNYAVIQYCYASAHAKMEDLIKLWRGAKTVWSYYDLQSVVPSGTPFYQAPLGVDEAFRQPFNGKPRGVGILTSGYVSGPGAEAIEEVAIAADRLRLPVVHLGPEDIVGMKSRHGDWQSVSGITDTELADLYRQSRWVSGLRYIEGFELPVLEGLCCGARPIVFDRPDMRQWYDGHAVFIPELQGEELVDCLEEVLSSEPEPVTAEEQKSILERFDWGRILPGFWNKMLHPTAPPLMHQLHKKFIAHYQVENLINLDRHEFEKTLHGMIGNHDPEVEGFPSAEGQRDMSVQFRWGHNHDFGTFKMQGQMGNRHLGMVTAAINAGVFSENLEGKKVLDVGCWTGGTSLMLAALGAEVTAVEEVRKYANCVNYLAKSFGVDDRLKAHGRSFYELWDDEDFQDRFDIAFIPGVLYHVTDLIVFLRIMFNSLKDGGISFVETESLPKPEDYIFYEGPSVFNRGGTKEQMNRRGWNWFLPSPTVLKQMYEDVGFVDVRVLGVGPRVQVVARREKHVELCRAGLSFRDIR